MKREQSCLGILIKALEGTSTTVELRNEMEITGQIENVDWVMKYSLLLLVLLDSSVSASKDISTKMAPGS